uniref:Venom peptide n=1 Tax=Dasymutilla klugii TaxID=1175364 RepID=A0A8T9VSP4_DASKL|nr:venom peptide precursor [Dasymutilla klugii]UOY17077.1 venom peptide precursor [Dasymutilla klugii]
MNLGILSYTFMVIVIMAFSNIAESNAEAVFVLPDICNERPRIPQCRG